MHFSRSPKLFGLAVFASSVSAGVLHPIIEQRDTNSTCETFGIDYQDGGSYFINQNSTEQFTAVSQFEGCNEGYADIWLVRPGGNELICSNIPTTPSDTNEVTTCPVSKNQLASGNYSILLFGDNGDGNPFSYQRDFQLNVGPQETATVTPTITFNVTQAPHTTITSTSTQFVTSIANATTTYTEPDITANVTRTIRPRPTTTTITRTITWSRTYYTHTAALIYTTVTASCTVPPRPECPDPTMTYQPRSFTPAAMKKKHHKKSENMSLPWIKHAPRVFKRAPDAPTVTMTASPAVSVTSTINGSTITDIASEVVSQTVYTTLAPSTIKIGTISATVTTLPTPIRTRFQFTYTTAIATKTESRIYTFTRTTTPYEAKTSCYQSGGHFGNGWRW